MNFFRRHKNRSVEEPKDDHVFQELYTMFKTHGDAILHGDMKLSLTASILILLNGSFQKITEGVNQPCFQVAAQRSEIKQIEMIYFVFDFIQKVVSFKLLAGAVSSDCPLLSLHYFKSLQVLEIRKIPIRYIKNLHAVRRQLRMLICCRSTNSVLEVVKQFGQDQGDVFILPLLSVLDLSYNNIADLQDDALKLLPALESLNLSYNCLECADSVSMPSVSYLNLGYNAILNVPVLPSKLSHTLTNLILRNNNLTTLQGMQLFTSLVLLDLTANCVIDFQELAPLAYLEKLLTLSLIDNPICYNRNYRLYTIRKLSPVKRIRKITLDGKELDYLDQCHLGEDVVPVSLSEYIPDRPLGRPKVHSLVGLANNLPNLSNDNAKYDTSTPVHNGRIKAKVRQASIADTPALRILPKSSVSMRSSENSTPQLSFASHESNSRNQSDSLNNIYSSRRSSLDNSLIWMNTSPGLMKGQFDRSSIDYDSWPVEHEGLHDSLEVSQYSQNFDIPTEHVNGMYHQGPLMTLSRVENEINNEEENGLCGVMSDEYVDNDDICDESSQSESDDDFDFAYLVQNITKSDDDFPYKIENLFISFKLPYLLERTDDGKLRDKLDLNYLQRVAIHDDDLRLCLRFDLIRLEWQTREYIFEQKEQLESFLEVIRPIEVKNYQKKMAEIKNCECLKCGTVFLKRDEDAVNITCPKCHSNMVINKNENHVNTIDNEASSTSSSSSSVSVTEMNNISLAFNHISAPVHIPFVKSTACISLSWPLMDQSSNVSARLSSTVPTEIFFQAKYENDEKDISKPFCNKQASRKSSQSSGQSRTSDKITFESVYSKFKNSLYKHSPASSTSINNSCSSKCRSHSRQPSRGSIRSKTPRSSMTTPVGKTKDPLMMYHDDYTKCDHRLKLYLTMNVYADADEVFWCQIRCACISYNKLEPQECLLSFSNKMAYIFAIVNEESDLPEDCVKKISSCSLSHLKHVNYGYSNQSFSLEFSKANHRFKFLTCDSEMTVKFLQVLQDEFNQMYSPHQNSPIFFDDYNKQTVAHIRKQVFHLAESPTEKGRRIFEHLSQFTSPTILKTRKVRLRSHQLSFLASELIDWLCIRREVYNRKEAIQIGQQLLDNGAIVHVSKEQVFKDDDTVFKFLQKQTSQSNNMNESHNEEAPNDDNEIETSINVYTIANVRVNEHDSAFHLRTILFTLSHVFLLEECHQWPLSRLHPPPALLRDHYVVKECVGITNVTAMEFYDDSPCYMTISFINEYEYDNEETNWLIRTETITELNKMASYIRNTWKSLFAIELKTSTQPSVIPVLDSYILL